MQTFISILRGINVSGQKKIRMADLKALYESLGFSEVETYIQSGNVLFDHPAAEESALVEKIESGILTTFGYEVSTLVRDRVDFGRVIAGSPFLNDARQEDPARLYVTFMKSQPTAEALDNLALPPGSRDEFAIGPREIYLFCPDGYGRTKLSNNFFERKLKVSMTTRNWKTVNRLFEMAGRRG